MTWVKPTAFKLGDVIASALRSYMATSLVWKHNVSAIYARRDNPDIIEIEYKDGTVFQLTLTRTRASFAERKADEERAVREGLQICDSCDVASNTVEPCAGGTNLCVDCRTETV